MVDSCGGVGVGAWRGTLAAPEEAEEIRAYNGRGDDPLLHLKPEDGWFGDPIPFFWDGTWHLFYLRDQQHHALPGGRHQWGHFASRDLVTWEELPLAIPLGEVGAPDSASCGTGSIVERDGVFHLYYLGRYIASNGDRRETICHATSRDLVAWEKDPANPISRPDPARYSLADWRDPFPIWNEEAGEYWMLVTATLKDGPASRRGCLALLVSPDLGEWTLREPFWAPHLGYDHECPDLFRWGDWWYLVYSTGGDPSNKGTMYRRSRSASGPWESMPVEALEGPLFYAGKTAFDGERRMLFGWVPTRERDEDAGRVQWGGHGATREVVQAADGALWVHCPPEVLDLGRRLPAPLVPRLGEWEIDGGSAVAAPREGLAYATIEGVPDLFTARVRFRPSGRASRFGLFLRTDPALERGYALRVEPGRGRVSLAPFGVRGRAAECGVMRPLPGAEGREVEVVVVVDGSIVEAYVDGRVALVGRFHDLRGESLGLFVEDGGGEFAGLDLRALAPDEAGR